MTENKSAVLYVARVLYPVRVLGPGARVGIWLSGCDKRCEGCLSPELQTRSEDQRTSVATLLSLIERIAAQYPIDGFTISGGEPFLQGESLALLLSELCAFSEDVLVYTGRLYEELPAHLLADVGVLIDGEYIASQNKGEPLRGSSNQRIHFLKPALREKYAPCLCGEGGVLQTFPSEEGVLTVGIPDARGNPFHPYHTERKEEP